MYQYYQFLSQMQPVYICFGEEAEKFRKDVEAIGLKTHLVDINDKCMTIIKLYLEGFQEIEEKISVQGVCYLAADFAEEYTDFGFLEIEQQLWDETIRVGEPIDGPFPTERTYFVPVIWHMYGKVEVKASTLTNAIKKALDSEEPLPEGSYVPDSEDFDEFADVETY